MVGRMDGAVLATTEGIKFIRSRRSVSDATRRTSARLGDTDDRKHDGIPAGQNLGVSMLDLTCLSVWNCEDIQARISGSLLEVGSGTWRAVTRLIYCSRLNSGILSSRQDSGGVCRLYISRRAVRSASAPHSGRTAGFEQPLGDSSPLGADRVPTAGPCTWQPPSE